jgi:hypothetical protein
VTSSTRVYVFGGYFVSAAPTYLPGAAWVPLTIAAAMRLGGEASRGAFLQLVILLTLQVLGGTPESFPQVWVLTLGAALFSHGATSHGRRTALVACATALALGISAAQLCPTLEYYLQTTRASGLGLGESMMKSLDPQTLWTLVFPHRLDGGVVAPMVDGTLALWWSIYIGVAPLLLVVVALPSRRAFVWVAVLAAALLASMGRHTPVFAFLHQHLPWLFASFRYPEKFFLAVHVSLAVLSAIGSSRVERWATRRGRRAARLVVVGLCVVTVADLWDVHWPSLLFTDWEALRRSAPPPELGKVSASDRIFGYEPSGHGLGIWAPKFTVGSDLGKIERYAWADMAGNVGLVYGVGFVNGLDSFRRRDDSALYQRLAASSLPESLRTLRTFGVHFLMGEVPLDDPSLELLRRGGKEKTWIYRTADPAPRAYLATSVYAVGSVGEALERIASPDFAPGASATSSEGAAARFPAGGPVRIVEDGPERLVLEAESAGEGFLVVNDSYFPGWRAEVDGVFTDIVRANGLVRGVPVSPGRHRIVMRYAPRSFQIGMALSLATLVFVYPTARALTPASSRVRRPRAFPS